MDKSPKHTSLNDLFATLANSLVSDIDHIIVNEVEGKVDTECKNGVYSQRIALNAYCKNSRGAYIVIGCRINMENNEYMVKSFSVYHFYESYTNAEIEVFHINGKKLPFVYMIDLDVVSEWFADAVNSVLDKLEKELESI